MNNQMEYQGYRRPNPRTKQRKPVNNLKINWKKFALKAAPYVLAVSIGAAITVPALKDAVQAKEYEEHVQEMQSNFEQTYQTATDLPTRAKITYINVEGARALAVAADGEVVPDGETHGALLPGTSRELIFRMYNANTAYNEYQNGIRRQLPEEELLALKGDWDRAANAACYYIAEVNSVRGISFKDSMFAYSVTQGGHVYVPDSIISPDGEVLHDRNGDIISFTEFPGSSNVYLNVEGYQSESFFNPEPNTADGEIKTSSIIGLSNEDEESNLSIIGSTAYGEDLQEYIKSNRIRLPKQDSKALNRALEESERQTR